MKPRLYKDYKPSSRDNKLSLRPLWRRYSKIVAILFLGWTVLETLFVRHAQVREAAKEAPPLGKEKVFIASIHWTTEYILRMHWNAAVVELAKAIGRDNVYISIHESGSLDDTKGALRDLDAQLEQAGISRRIVLDNTTHEDEIGRVPTQEGWLPMPNGTVGLRRIPYLARLRNQALEPLYDMQKKGLKFDKVLFLNDVVFDNEDVRTLLATRGGQYAAACSLDFKETGSFYDTFALRDSEGHNKLMKTWPYFRAHASRQEVKASRPVPVKSCWNGIVAMDAEAFYGGSLAFRGIADSLAVHHLEGSECCLIHADNPFSWKKGVWLNTNVRVGYSPETYAAVRASKSSAWVSTYSIVIGSWTNRIYRWTTSPVFFDAPILEKFEKWRVQAANHFESGLYCLVDEMQVIMWNGWEHV